jgi:hypothetical protein
MRRALFTLPILAILAACNAGAEEKGAQAGGQQGRRDFQVATFNGVSLEGSHDVIVTVGGAPSVRAEGAAEVLERLDIRVENGTLEIGTRRTSNFGFGRESGSATIHVTVPSLAAASIGGSGDLLIDRVEGAQFTGAIGGSGNLQIRQLRVGQAQFAVAGSGNIQAAGAAERTNLSVAGSGDIDLSAVETRTAAISVVGSGDVRSRVTGTAEVSVMGSGDVEVSGPARCSVNRMGSGDVRCNI